MRPILTMTVSVTPSGDLQIDARGTTPSKVELMAAAGALQAQAWAVAAQLGARIAALPREAQNGHLIERPQADGE